MDELPSSEFRKVYGKLRRPTTVTVNGHVIGHWMPLRPSRPPQEVQWEEALRDPEFITAVDEGLQDVAAGRVHAFRPVPKPSQRKR